jgi:hypothetical protein
MVDDNLAAISIKAETFRLPQRYLSGQPSGTPSGAEPQMLRSALSQPRNADDRVAVAVAAGERPPLPRRPAGGWGPSAEAGTAAADAASADRASTLTRVS